MLTTVKTISSTITARCSATKLMITTGNPVYQAEARKRAANLARRQFHKGYFIANEKDRRLQHFE